MSNLNCYCAEDCRSTLSLVGSGRRSIVPETNGSQRVGGCNPLLTCSPKPVPELTVICSPSAEPKVAKNFKRKSSIPIQICFSKNDNIQIHHYIEMPQDLNPSTSSSLVIFMYWACENYTFSATPPEKLQQHPLVFPMNRTYCTFFLSRLYLATPSSWSKHHFVVIRKPEQQVCKPSHCRTKQ